MWSIVVILSLICGYTKICWCQKITDNDGRNTCSVMDSISTLLTVTANVQHEISSAYYPENVPLKREYDFVIVGAGPAGCVLANRLSEDYTVLLLEAGRAENPMITSIPMAAPNLQSTDYNWNYATEVQKDACLSMRGERCNFPHGRGLGGSTIINYMIYTRGNRRDFDRWAKAGNEGWSYDDVLPYFQKFERSNVKLNASEDSYGKSGPVVIESPPFRTEIADAFVKSAVVANHPEVNYNSGDQIGVSYLHQSTKNGWRQTAAKSYLSDIKNRKNLTISIKSWATKLLFDTNATLVKGVKFVRNKREYTVKARREVILSAGAFESPKLLMLSGIGPEDDLKKLKIDVIKDLPVGKTMYEHMAVYGPIFTADNLGDGLVNQNDVLQLRPILEIMEGQGPLTITGIESLLYMKTNNSISSDPKYPDIEILQSMATVGFDTAEGTRHGIRLSDEAYNAVFKPLGNRRAFQMLPMLLHPRSKGYLKLKSRNPFHHPSFYPNFFADPRDIDTLLEGVREIIKIVGQEAFVKLGVQLYNVTVPGCEDTEFNSDAYWKCYIRHLSATLHHQIGSCRMGPKSDPDAVVDASGRVHGFSNLRVADISIIPATISAHTASISFMIGEKISDIVKDDWKPKQQSHIQRLTRSRPKRLVLDWQYEDPDHTTEAKPTSTTSRKVYSLSVTPTTTPRSMDLKEMLKMLNMTALHEQSQLFQNPTIGDIGTILWGFSPHSKAIDFKSKLAEHLNSTDDDHKMYKLHMLETKTTTAGTTVKQSHEAQSTVSATTISINEEEISTPRVNSLNSNAENATSVTGTTVEHQKTVTETSITEPTTVHMSAMAKIMASAPSLDEDLIRTFKLNETDRYGHGRTKAKYITEELKHINSTVYVEETTTLRSAADNVNSTVSTDVNEATTVGVNIETEKQ